MNVVAPPFTSVRGYHLRNRMITYDTKDGEELLATGWFWIAEPVSCPVTENRSYLLEISPVGSRPSTLLLRPEDFNIKYLKKTLGERGIILHQENKVLPYLSMTAAFGGCTEKEPRVLIENPGWFANAQGFYTGRKVFVSKQIDESRYRFEPVIRAPVALKGTLADWQEQVGQHAQANPVLLAVMCVFMASPFLAKLGLGTRIVNIYGGKGTGKTLCSQVGASVWGNGVDPAAGLYNEDPPYVTKFSTTINGIESLLSRYSPLPIGLDELTEQDSPFLGQLTYKVASGSGKHRSKTDGSAANMNRWLLTIVATAERSIADAVTEGGKPLLGGQADRAIDIPVDGLGVITDFGQFDSFQQITRHLKNACAGYYGAAGEAILQFACDNPEVITDLIGRLPELEERLLPVNCGDGERRVVKFLAGAVVAGLIAIRAGALTCNEEEVEVAVNALVGEWWRGRGGSLRRIAEFVHANEALIEKGPPRLGSNAKAFRLHDRLVIPDYVFESEFAGEHRTLLAELAGLNALIREQNSRNKSRYCNNQLFAYSIRSDRIEPILSALAEQVEQPISDASRSLIKLNDIEID